MRAEDVIALFLCIRESQTGGLLRGGGRLTPCNLSIISAADLQPTTSLSNSRHPQIHSEPI